MDQSEIIKNMTNIGDSGQDEFITNWTELAKQTLYEQGVSNKYIESNKAAYILAKVITDLIEDGELSNTTQQLIATLRVNHPHSEDDVNV